MVYGITDLEKAVGFTVNQLRDRLDLLSPIFAEDLQRGKRGKILVGDKILAALRRMVELERDGLSPKVAQGVIVREVGNGDGNGSTIFAEGWSTSEDLVKELRRQIEDQRREIDWLRARVEELTPLALPRPRRRFAWLRLLGRGGAS